MIFLIIKMYNIPDFYIHYIPIIICVHLFPQPRPTKLISIPYTYPFFKLIIRLAPAHIIKINLLSYKFSFLIEI